MAPVAKSVGLPNDLTLPYIEQGNSSGAALILIHALVDSSCSFELVVPHVHEVSDAMAV